MTFHAGVKRQYSVVQNVFKSAGEYFRIGLSITYRVEIEVHAFPVCPDPEEVVAWNDNRVIRFTAECKSILLYVT